MTLRDPDYRGAGIGAGQWRAWNVPLQHRAEEPDANVATFLLYCPGAHAFWSYWWICLVHLRPVARCDPAIVTVPGAGWEITSFAQDPDHEPDPDHANETFHYLTPLDWVVQFGDVKTDHEAERVTRAVVTAIMTGKVSPDADFARFWADSVRDTAQHFAAGGHPEN